MGEQYVRRTDRLTAELAALDRDHIKPQILNFHSRTRLDFTEEFLDRLSTEQLRQLLLAAMLYLSRE